MTDEGALMLTPFAGIKISQAECSGPCRATRIAPAPVLPGRRMTGTC